MGFGFPPETKYSVLCNVQTGVGAYVTSCRMEAEGPFPQQDFVVDYLIKKG